MLVKLQESVRATFGGRIAYQKDCKILRDSIMAKTSRAISEATLRRLFGFLATNSSPSRATLDTLSLYAGFGSWAEFCRAHSQAAPSGGAVPIEELWGGVAKAAAATGRSTINRIRIASGIGFDIAVGRHFLDGRMRDFMTSGCGATALIAPGGYGKTTALAKWYLNHVGAHGDDIVALVQARQLEPHLRAEVEPSRCLLPLLGLDIHSSFLDDCFGRDGRTPGRLLLIIDGLDGVSPMGHRRGIAHRMVVELVEHYTATGRLKVVVATRSSDWDVLQRLVPTPRRWMGVEPERFSAHRANIPGLSFDEVQQVLDRSVNRRVANRLLVYAMPLDLCLMVSYPYFLQLFVRLYSPDMAAVGDHIELLLEFLRRQVYETQYAEQKDDILSFIAERSRYGQREVSKHELKQVYPVHVRQPDGYFAAYEDMLSFGIVQEDVQPSPELGYLCAVRIANQNLLWVLSARSILKNKKFDSVRALRWLHDEVDGCEQPEAVLGALFKLAYMQRRFDVLERFFDLDEQLLCRTLRLSPVAHMLSTNPEVCARLMPMYMRHPMARRLLLEHHVDVNHMATSYKSMLISPTIRRRGHADNCAMHTMLAYCGLLTLDGPLLRAHVEAMGDEPPAAPTMAGAWFACRLLYADMMGQPLSSWADAAMEHLRSLRSAEGRNDFGEILMAPMMALRSPQQLVELSAPSMYEPEASLAMEIAHQYAHFVAHTATVGDLLADLSQRYSKLHPLRSVPYIVMGEIMCASRHLELNELETAYTCMRNGMELATASGLKLLEASLLEHLKVLIERIAEPQWAKELSTYREKLWEGFGFPP